VDNLLNANLSTFISLMGQSIPGQAFFFCNWVVTNSALSVSLSLLRPVAPIIYFIKKRFFCVTERDYRLLDAPPGMLLSLSVSLGFSISPFLIAIQPATLSRRTPTSVWRWSSASPTPPCSHSSYCSEAFSSFTPTSPTATTCSTSIALLR
jgi:hypothetical protein